jgi:hypothetical protein
MVLGSVEAFTVEQVSGTHDTNVLSTQRLNRAALPHMRRCRDGLLVWVGSHQPLRPCRPPRGHHGGAEYEELYPDLMEQAADRLAAPAPADADPEEVARRIASVVDMEKGTRPFRVHIDPADDGAEVVNAVGDRVRKEFYERIRMADLLRPVTPDA